MNFYRAASVGWMVAPWMEQLLLCGAHYSQRPGGSPHHQASLGAQWWSWLWWSWIILNNIIFAIIIIVHFVWSSGWAKTIIADNLLTKSCKTSPIKVLSDVVDNYNVWTGWKGLERWNKWNYRHFVGEMMTSRAFSPSCTWASGHSLTSETPQNSDVPMCCVQTESPSKLPNINQH